MSGNKQEYIAVGKIGGPWGLKGEAKLQVYNPESEILKKTRFIYLKAGFSFSKVRVLSCRPRGKSWGIVFDSYDSPEKVRELLGQEIYLKTSELASKSPGEFYIHELVGMKVISSEGVVLGQVQSVENYGSVDLLNIKDETAEKTKEYLIPWIPDVIQKVEIEKGQIVIRVLEGLIESEEKA